MKILVLGFMFLLSQLATVANASNGPTTNSTNCKKYSVRCDCFAAIPFEGFESFFVETCDGKEQWWKSWGQQFNTETECREAIKKDKACLKHSTK